MMTKDLHRLSNILKFRGRESEHSLILNLNPSPITNFMCQMVYFFAQKRTSFTHLGGGVVEAPRPPFSTHFTLFHTHYGEKKKKQRGKNKQSRKKRLV